MPPEGVSELGGGIFGEGVGLSAIFLHGGAVGVSKRL